MKHTKRGFTLVEVIVSTALLAITVTGFMTMVLGSSNALAKVYRMDKQVYANGSLAENRQGDRTGEIKTLVFYDDAMNEAGTFELHEYKVHSNKFGDMKSYEMYYFDYE